MSEEDEEGRRDGLIVEHGPTDLPATPEEKQAELEKQLQEIVAKNPSVLLMFFELPIGEKGEPGIGMFAMGKLHEVTALYIASHKLMDGYVDAMMRPPPTQH